MTPGEAARRSARYKAVLIRNVLIAMDRWGDTGWKKNVLTKRMQFIAKGVPANPPPGPLGIRSGKLASTVRSDKARYFAQGSQFSKALRVGGIKGVRYARIHEHGGWTGRNLESYIDPRPYALPSYMDTRRELSRLVKGGIAAAGVEVYGN